MPSIRVDFKHVRMHASFEKVAAHYNMTLVGKGEQFSTFCTFHEERTPSLKINVTKNIFKCFGCGAHGNILDFVTYMEGGDPNNDGQLRAAAVKLAAMCGIEPMPEKLVRPSARVQATTPTARTQVRAVPIVELKAAPLPAPDNGHGNKPLAFTLKLNQAHPYLSERGLPPAIVEAFGLGVADRGLMKGRLAIPIHNEDGALIAYAGRWIEPELPHGSAKYLLPEKFEKQKVLFNLNRIPSGTKHVFLVESYFSVFRLHELGIPVVSTMGHDVSVAQSKLLKSRGVDHVTVLFDGDEAGRGGTAHSVPTLAQDLFVFAPDVPDAFKPHRATAHEIAEFQKR